MQDTAAEDEKRKEIVGYAEQKGALVSNRAVDLLGRLDDFRKVVDALIAENAFVIDEKKINDAVLKAGTKVAAAEEVFSARKASFRARARDVDAELRVMAEYDVTSQSCSEGNVKDFLNYFRDKYNFLYAVLAKRQGMNPRGISDLGKMQRNSEVHLIGMVVKKWVTKNGNLAIKIDDLDADCIVLALKDNRQLFEFGEQVLLDGVIGVKGTKIGDEMVIAKEILLPDLPQRTQKMAERDLSAVVISDLHVGSKLFMEREFGRFLSWLNGDGGETGNAQQDVGKIKYLFMAGDNVDGVGIYPEQFDQLAIKDMHEQYEKLAELIEQVPEYIEIIMCPGQHDAVRRADPQPAIPKEFAGRLAEMKNVHLIGSPGWVEVEGLKCLIYHGASLHDLISSVNFLSMKEPQKAMRELLRRRDLMPGYGLRQPYVPEKKDFMLIREEPDLYIGGDMHHKGYETYRGCLIVNSGCWQEQTDFQIKQGHIPTPGIATKIDLKTMRISEINFGGGRFA